MTTSTTIPAKEIAQALDLLIYHGVLDESTADHHLGEFLHEIGMTLSEFIDEQL
jgi:hypothetical protein